MLREIVGLGFRTIELGHGIRISLVEGIERFVGKGKARISTLHNFCPLPVEITRAAPDCYQFSSANPYERARAVKLTRQTIDFAVRMGARLVVLHLGSVAMPKFTDRLAGMARAGGIYSREYVALKIKGVTLREKRAAPFVKRTLECLREIVPYAGERGVRLGFEGRYGLEEIPTEREHHEILAEFREPHVGYWHDFGHIQVKHNLGLLDHFEWLESVAPRYMGGHLHDTEWPDTDHRAPFTGGIDYARLVPLLPRDAMYVWEMGPRRSPTEITESLHRWRREFPWTVEEGDIAEAADAVPEAEEA
jgi:sugar phosphate isomerase/epimerase